MRKPSGKIVTTKFLRVCVIAMGVPMLMRAQAPPTAETTTPQTTILAKSDSKGTTVCNVTKKTNPNNGEAEIVITDTNGTQNKKLKSGFCAYFPLSGAAIALSATASASTIAGMTTATVVAATGVIAGTSVAVVTGAAVGAATAGTLGGLAAAGTFSSGKSTSPCGQNQQGNNNCQGQNQQ